MLAHIIVHEWAYIWTQMQECPENKPITPTLSKIWLTQRDKRLEEHQVYKLRWNKS